MYCILLYAYIPCCSFHLTEHLVTWKPLNVCWEYNLLHMQMFCMTAVGSHQQTERLNEFFKYNFHFFVLFFKYHLSFFPKKIRTILLYPSARFRLNLLWFVKRFIMLHPVLVDVSTDTHGYIVLAGIPKCIQHNPFIIRLIVYKYLQ